MQQGQRKLITLIGVTIFVVVAAWLGLYAAGVVPAPGSKTDLFKLSDRLADLEVIETADGLRYDFDDELLTAEEFTARLYERHPGGKRGTIFSLLNITGNASLFWVLLGLLGQILFTGRMIVQWLASEKEKRSVIPTAFWWMSLGGSTMLIIYFIWRVEPIGILGQCTGWFIYVRNLWFIYAKPDDAIDS